MERDIDIGAEVRGSDGRVAGTVSALVLDPATDELVAVVIHRGDLAPVEKLLPASEVTVVEDHQVRISMPAAAVDELPDLEDRERVPLRYDGERPGERIWTHPPRRALPRLIIGGTSRDIPAAEEEWRNVPTTSRLLREGMDVIDEMGVILGEVDEVVSDPASGLATHIVVRLTHDSGHVKAVPVAWIARSDEDAGITLSVPARDVEGLADYHLKRR
ncbi:MAG: PRC-barrel domain-containing protein [Anaerolineae bacterium]